MSNAATGIAWAHSASATQTQKLVLMKIADMDGDGGAWPSMKTLAAAGMVTIDAARKVVRQLEELGEIRTHLNEGGGIRTQKHMRTNVYEFLLVCPWYCDGSSAHKDLRDENNSRLRPKYWAEMVAANTSATPQPQERDPAPGTGGPQPQELPNHNLTTHIYGDRELEPTFTDVREEEKPPVREFHPGREVAKVAAAIRRAEGKPPLTDPAPAKPRAPYVPRYEPEARRIEDEPRTPAEEASVNVAALVECPDGFGSGKNRLHWFPGTLAGCARCGRDALDIAVPALLDQEATE